MNVDIGYICEHRALAKQRDELVQIGLTSGSVDDHRSVTGIADTAFYIQQLSRFLAIESVPDSLNSS